MFITPADIQAQSFRVVFRGYDIHEVDSFLERVEEGLSQLSAAVPEAVVPEAVVSEAVVPATVAIDANPAALPDAAGTPDRGAAEPGQTVGEEGAASRALRTLQRAEQLADQMLADAGVEAADIRARAQAEAETILGAARVEAATVEADLRLRRQREVDALAARAQQLQAEVKRLADLERRSREALRSWLAQHQGLLGEHSTVVPLDAPGSVCTERHADPVLAPAAAS